MEIGALAPDRSTRLAISTNCTASRCLAQPPGRRHVDVPVLRSKGAVLQDKILAVVTLSRLHCGCKRPDAQLFYRFIRCLVIMKIAANDYRGIATNATKLATSFIALVVAIRSNPGYVGRDVLRASGAYRATRPQGI